MNPTEPFSVFLFFGLSLVLAILAYRLRHLERLTKELIHCRGQLNAMQHEINSLWNLVRDIINIMTHVYAGNGQYQEAMLKSLHQRHKETARILRFVEDQIAMFPPTAVPAHLLAERERLQEHIRTIESQIDQIQE